MALAWLRPRAVVMNNAHPSFSVTIGAGQIDLGWWLIKTFEYCGLATGIVTPTDLPARKELQRLSGRDEGCPVLANLQTAPR